MSIVLLQEFESCHHLRPFETLPCCIVLLQIERAARKSHPSEKSQNDAACCVINYLLFSAALHHAFASTTNNLLHTEDSSLPQCIPRGDGAASNSSSRAHSLSPHKNAAFLFKPSKFVFITPVRLQIILLFVLALFTLIFSMP